MLGKISFSFFTISCLLFAGCQNRPEEVNNEIPDRQVNEVVYHPSHEPGKKGVPFSDAVQVGDLFFLSGQIGMDHGVRKLVSGGIEAETRQALVNIKKVLAHHDLEMDNVVKVTVMLADIADFEAFNEIYRKYLPQKPARSVFAASGLALGALVEIEVVASR